MKEDYSDIINLPHHESRNHPQMPMEARAAQFAPFAALTGYDAVIHETARLTDRQVELDEYDNEQLNRIFSELMDSLEKHPVVAVSYFKPDEHKAGGAYMTVSGKLKKIDTYEQIMKMEDGTVIPIDNIMDLQF
ncbi:MAG: YolD-like family protein [Prevotella sp.]|nr:YolD-like family protein [Prevotella sp.]